MSGASDLPFEIGELARNHRPPSRFSHFVNRIVTEQRYLYSCLFSFAFGSASNERY